MPGSLVSPRSRSRRCGAGSGCPVWQSSGWAGCKQHPPGAESFQRFYLVYQCLSNVDMSGVANFQQSTAHRRVSVLLFLGSVVLLAATCQIPGIPQTLTIMMDLQFDPHFRRCLKFPADHMTVMTVLCQQFFRIQFRSVACHGGGGGSLGVAGGEDGCFQSHGGIAQ